MVSVIGPRGAGGEVVMLDGSVDELEGSLWNGLPEPENAFLKWSKMMGDEGSGKKAAIREWAVYSTCGCRWSLASAERREGSKRLAGER